MPAQESAVMNDDVTGKVKATAPRASKKKAKLTPAEIRAQIKDERVEMKRLKNFLKDDKADLRDALKEGKANVLVATKALKATTTASAKVIKQRENNVTVDEKAVARQQGVIDKLTAKLN